MSYLRFAPTLSLSILLAAGCGSSHSPEDDAGAADASNDSGRADASTDAGTDGGASDAGTEVGCDAQRAEARICADDGCDGPPQWFWNGSACSPIPCGECDGADCEAGYATSAACEAAYASCDARLCRSTGGDWQWWAEECGHFRCGFPPPVNCLVGQPVCDCGARAEFVEGEGCVAVDDCPEVDPQPPETLCPATGGTWSPICCNTECGDYCPLPCAQDACDCGPMRVFDTLRGCVLATRCFERDLNESCGDGARCEPGTICCDQCGGAGCANMPRCIAPICDDDPAIDPCGNNLLAP